MKDCKNEIEEKNRKAKRIEFLADEENEHESELYLKVLDTIESIVSKKFAKTLRPFPFTLHDHTHCQNVEKNIYTLIPSEKFSKLKCREKFLLISSIWLHDIGMIPTLFHSDYKEYLKVMKNQEFEEYIKDRAPDCLQVYNKKDQQYLKKIRTNHARRSFIYVSYSSEIQKLSDFYEDEIQGNFDEDIKYISEICRLHPLKTYDELDKLNNDYWINKEIRLPLLIAYLRIADTLHIPNKGNDSDFANFLAFGPDTISKFHWFKSRYTKSVCICPEKNSITVINKIPNNLLEGEELEWSNKILPLQNIIKKEIQNELDAVKDILCKGGISFFSIIKTSYKKDSSLTESFEIQEYELILKNVDLIFDKMKTPSSSLISENVVKTIKLLLESKSNHRFDYLSSFYNNVFEKDMKGRSRHALLNSVQEKLKYVLKHPSEDELEKFSNYINEWELEREKNLKLVASNSFFIFEGNGPILLYGYSDTVLRCIEHFIKKTRKKHLDLYVCEVRPKTEYRYNNRLVFSDGLLNIKKLKEIDPGRIKIHSIPDAAVSYLFEMNRDIKVLLSANAIDADGNATHTLGVSMIADVASVHEIPVYIVAESSKFVNISMRESLNKLQREEKWFTTDIAFESVLKKCNNFNPREDIISSDKIRAFVTERGVLNLKSLIHNSDEYKQEILSHFT